MQEDQYLTAAHLDRILNSAGFAKSARMQRFLRLLVEQSIANRHAGAPDRMKESEIGVRVFDREVGYDPKTDSIVRVEATRLRKKLKEYYETEGRSDAIRVHLPSGRYEVELIPQVSAPGAGVPVTPEPRPSARRMWVVGIGAAALIALAGSLTIWRGSGPPIEAKPFTFFQGNEISPAISPDGSRIAFTWDGDSGPAAVFTQPIGAETPVRLTHSQFEEFSPAWSPDGREIAFLRHAADQTLELWVAGVQGASERRIARMERPPLDVSGGLAWSPDGKVLATPEYIPGNNGARVSYIALISPSTGVTRPFHPGGTAEGDLSGPAFSPDGKSLAYVRSTGAGVVDVYLADFPDGRERRLTFDRTEIHGFTWMANGSALVVSSQRGGNRTSLWRVPVAGGQPVRIGEAGDNPFEPAAGRGGLLAFSRRIQDVNIWRRDSGAAGQAENWIASSGLDSCPQVSPDGSRIAFRSNRTGASEIWLAAADRHSERRLTHFDGPLTGSPHWSPDGQRIAFDSRAMGNSDIYVIGVDGGEPQRLTSGAANESVPSWSTDGHWIYYSSDRGGTWSVWRQPAAGGSPELVRPRGFAPVESPDGQYLYYTKGPNEAGLWRATLRDGPSGLETLVVPTLEPPMSRNWAIAGQRLYYVSRDLSGGEEKAWISSADLTGRNVERLFDIRHPIGWDGGLAVSPQGRIYFAQLDRSGGDIFLIRDFK